MVRAARATDRLVCVCETDLLAPHDTRERRRHQDLCEMLCTLHDFPLTLEDFLSATEDEDGNMIHTTPLEAAELREGDCLLVVSCAYRLSDLRDEDLRNKTDSVDNWFTIAEDSLSFNVIEAVP